MHKFAILLMIAAFIVAIPSFYRILCKDFHKLLWSDVFFDVIIIAVAILSRNVVFVVVAQVIIGAINGWIYQKRADDIYTFMRERKVREQSNLPANQSRH